MGNLRDVPAVAHFGFMAHWLCYHVAANPMRAKIVLCSVLAAAVVGTAGCFYPPASKPPPEAKTSAVIDVPYDLTWDAIHTVVKKNDYKLEGDDPDHGIVEAEAHEFSLADADCGQLKSIGSRYDADPLPGSSAVYNIRIEPSGPNATAISVNATFSTPVHVPLHPINAFQCVSRGVQETRLLKEIQITAQTERRPAEATPSRGLLKSEPLTSGRPTLMRDKLSEPTLH